MAFEVGSVLDGKVTGISKFGAFVQLEGGKSGLVHISEISNSYVSDINQFLSDGQDVKVKIIGIDDKGRINLSIKKAIEQEHPSTDIEEKKEVSDNRRTSNKSLSFEEMISKFKQESDDKLSDIRDVRENRKVHSKRK